MTTMIHDVHTTSRLDAQQTPTGEARPLRVAFMLPGLHRVNRGAEVAIESIAGELGRRDDFDITLFGSGDAKAGRPYRFVHAACLDRRRFRAIPSLPGFRDETWPEELTFAACAWQKYDPNAFDVTVSCSYPYLNWMLTRRSSAGHRPRHVHITQNGDWPAVDGRREFRYFRCDALVCTNPSYYRATRDRWNATLIPNGVNSSVFRPGRARREAFGLAEGRRIVGMVSALIPSKRVMAGIAAVSQLDGVCLAVAGDGPLRRTIEDVGRTRLGDRFAMMQLDRAQMPDFYRSIDVMLHMSIDEPSSNAYLEALATGLPIVTHDRDVTRWTFHEHAFLVDTTNEAATAAMVQKATVSTNEDAVTQRAAFARRRFAWSAIAGRYAEVLRAASRGQSMEALDVEHV